MPDSQKTHVISILAVNKPGGLMRMCQVFTRRGFNIDSLIACPAMNGKYSRVTATSKGDPDNLDQIIRQLQKLVDVISCVEHSECNSIVREMLLVKMKFSAENRSEVLHIVEHFGGKTVDITLTSCVIQCSGNSEKLDAMIDLLSNFEIIEMVRSGKMLMARGEEAT